MSFSDDAQEPEEAGPPAEFTPEEASFPEETILPEGFTPLVETAHVQRSRRRRAARKFVLPGADERAALMDNLARRAFPSFEFFVFALLCGAVLGAGYLLDLKANSQAILLLGLLLAPLLTPWVGMTLAATTGSWRFFLQTLGGMLVASLLVFLTGGLAGIAGRLWLPHPPYFLPQADPPFPDLVAGLVHRGTGGGAAGCLFCPLRTEANPTEYPARLWFIHACQCSRF